jgi:hypothetical protein
MRQHAASHQQTLQRRVSGAQMVDPHRGVDEND